jgi:endo-1,4-beta-mannosidase
MNQNRRLAAPIVQIDHYRNHFAGGRWIMLNCEPSNDFYRGNAGGDLLKILAMQAASGAESLRVTPAYPLFLPGEPWEFEIEWQRLGRQAESAVQLELTVENDGKIESEQKIDLTGNVASPTTTLVLNPVPGPGFRTVTARLICGGVECGVYHTGFWIRDRDYLASGPKVTIDQDFFKIDGRQLPVVGTTYMASDAQRLYFRYPNPYVWDQDMNQIAQSGLNMLRTGWWTDWDAITGNTGIATERTVRTMEAFLMTCRKHGLPVQWTTFAFMPDVFGGGNPYLDPEAQRREEAFVASVVSPFKDVPFLIWDLINEPSFDNPKRFWITRPNGDAEELRQWNAWLLKRYKTREEIESAWQTVLDAGDIPLPVERDFSWQSANDGGRPLAIFDFNLFAQDKFMDWAHALRTTIRATGSNQLVTVGQDEGGGLGSASPAFFKSAVDFTTVHTWWLNDGLLWDSLAARQDGLPMLVQETGVMNEYDADGRPRRTPENEAALLERKVGMALGTGAGAIEWLWDINAVMRSQQEVTIGVIRPDGTEKPEAQVLEAYAKFAGAACDHFQHPAPEEVAIMTSQALLYSPISDLAIAAQNRAVRVMNYQCHMPARLIAENHAEEIRGSKLVILPSPQALQETTWRTLLSYVEQGGNLLITGPAERDEHWRRTTRLRELGIDATAGALNCRGGELNIEGKNLDIGFAQNIQQRAENLTIAGGASYLEFKKGKGSIFLTAYPVELAEAPQATYEVYKNVLSRLGLASPFEGQAGSSSVLIRPVEFADSILYLFASESLQDENIDIKDRLTGAQLKFMLPAQRTTLMLLRKSDGKLLDAYNPPAF